MLITMLMKSWEKRILVLSVEVQTLSTIKIVIFTQNGEIL